MGKLFWLLALGASLIASCSNAQTVDARKFESGLKQDVQLIDVRTPEEYAEGHLPDAVLMNVNAAAFEQQIESLDKNKPVFVYCRSGKRSHTAYNILRKKGFTKVAELKGGIAAWEEAGKKVVTE